MEGDSGLARGFGSDNHAGIHPEVLAAIARANQGHVHSYGDDPWTRRVEALVRRHFGPQAVGFPVFTGTAANVLSVAALNRPFEAVVCAAGSHLNTDECGAAERFAGCKLLPVPAVHGRLTPALVQAHVGGRGDEHQVRPGLLSITQATEVGTVYRPEEIRALADWAHGRGMRLHVDGARLANAAVFLGLGLGQITTDVGVDVLSFGGTKNGLLMAEAVIFLDASLAADFRYLRKQAMQLASKMRFVAAQLEVLLGTDLWRRSAAHANAMARRLAERVERIPGVAVTHPVEANGVFARLPASLIAGLQQETFFYVWDEPAAEVRWMTAFDTTEADVDAFAERLARAVTRGQT